MDIVKKNLLTISVELKRLGLTSVVTRFSGSEGKSDGLTFRFPGMVKFPPFTSKLTYFISPRPGPASDGKPLAEFKHADFYTLVEDTFKEDMAARGYANWADGLGSEGIWAVTQRGEVTFDAYAKSPEDAQDNKDVEENAYRP